MEGKTVTSAQYQKGFDGNDNVSIKATIDGQVCYVPINKEIGRAAVRKRV